MRLEEKIERYIKQAEKLAEERGIKIGEEQGNKNATLKIAKKLKEQGMVVAQIAEVTALSVSEIEEL